MKQQLKLQDLLMQIKIGRPVSTDRGSLLSMRTRSKTKQQSKSKGIRLSISNSKKKCAQKNLNLIISERTCQSSKQKKLNNRSIARKCYQLCGDDDDTNLQQDKFEIDLSNQYTQNMNPNMRTSKYMISSTRQTKRWSERIPGTPINKILYMQEQDSNEYDRQYKQEKQVGKLRVFSSKQMGSQKYCSTQISANNSTQFAKYN